MATTIAHKEVKRGEQRAARAFDIDAFRRGTHSRLFDWLGGRLRPDGGAQFSVWAPHAQSVSVVGAFNRWSSELGQMKKADESGIWSAQVHTAKPGDCYKFQIVTADGTTFRKSDPFGFTHELASGRASILAGLDYEWQDAEWMRERGDRISLRRPVSIYEAHLGSWRRPPGQGESSFLNYREIAAPLAEHVRQHGFTHVELLPVMEHGFYGSWGYQTTGYFAPSSRYGSPQDLMFLIDYLHQQGLGVILDWVPSHFPCDEEALARFDGQPLFEYSDPRQGKLPEWNSCVFDFSKGEVRSFLLSSAIFWLDRYHADGLRVDAVASMLYLDYHRQPGEWVPNRQGGRENLEAIDFLKQLNTEIYRQFPDTHTFAEESTAWPNVSRPVDAGGLGFGYKWDMGFTHDTLHYLSHDPLFRKQQHNKLTFRGLYLWNENFVLPLSHDEAARLPSLLERMPGDPWQKYANLRLLLGYLFLQPGKKLLFMGTELGDPAPWSHDRALDWRLADEPFSRGMMQWVGALNHVYRSIPALHAGDCFSFGFEWIDCQDSEQSVLSWIRRAKAEDEGAEDDLVIAVANFTPVVRHNYRVGAPASGFWQEVLNGDAKLYGGSGVGNLGGVETSPLGAHGRPHLLTVTLPPLAVVAFRRQAGRGDVSPTDEHR